MFRRIPLHLIRLRCCLLSSLGELRGGVNVSTVGSFGEIETISGPLLANNSLKARNVILRDDIVVFLSLGMVVFFISPKYDRVAQ